VVVYVSHCILSKVSVQDIGGQSRGVGTKLPISSVCTKRPSSNRGDKYPNRSCTHGALDPTQIQRFGHGGIPEGKDRTDVVPRTKDLNEEVLGTAPVVAWLLRIKCRFERRADT